MRRILLRLVIPKEERKAIKILAELYYPKVENSNEETANEVKEVLAKLMNRFR